MTKGAPLIEHFRTPPFEWTCGHCSVKSVITPEHYHSGYTRLAVGETALGETALVYTAMACPNPDCRELSLAIRLADYKASLGHAYPIGTAGEAIRDWVLLPDAGEGDGGP